MNDSGNDPQQVHGTRTQAAATAEAKRLSSEIYDLLGVAGNVSEPGPGISACGDRDPEKYFRTRHPWSLTGPSADELRTALTRLKDGLPGRGWKIVSFGPNNSRNKSLTLTADHHGKKFAVSAVLRERHKPGDPPPSLGVTLVSGCYEVPEGERVDGY
ncbi:hypothetical protein ACWCQL_05135 [Streptomyces sp. NPDC002073]|uniref:hypothetical protein n=1 Tax=Streptomyces sp. NBC_00239 TaxID=2903640 RepID=UPI002E2BC1DB|nr:hypothetical protein [Streptomyces sp. NBC_00239]